jgi:hypothetical protein
MEYGEKLFFAGLAFAIVAIVCGIVVGTTHSNAHYNRTAQVCIEKGGTWIPIGHGACIVR